MLLCVMKPSVLKQIAWVTVECIVYVRSHELLRRYTIELFIKVTPHTLDHIFLKLITNFEVL